MTEPFNRRALADDITVTHIRTLRASGGRTRRVSISTSPRGEAVLVETFGRAGDKIGGALTLFASEAADVLAALTEAAAAIGVAIAAKPAP